MVAVVDEAFVNRYFPNEDPIGRGIDIGNGTDGFYQIVGVVGSVRYEGLGSSPEPTMYVPFKQGVFSTMWIVARTDGDPVQQSSAVRQAVTSIDPSLPAYSIASLASIVSDSVAQRRFSMLLLGVFALIALFLAAIGLYGVVAYSVNQRTQEIGVRMAIGAQRGDVFRLIVGGGMKLALIGVDPRSRWRPGGGARRRDDAVRRDAVRSRELRHDRRRSPRRRRPRVLHARASGDARRSAGGAPAGVRAPYRINCPPLTSIVSPTM